MGRLSGKVAVVTECGRGFGDAMATLFAQEGAALSICDVIPVSELVKKVGSKISSVGGEVICSQVDVSSENQVRQMVKKTIERFGTLDISVNNVGIAGPTRDCWQITLQEWNRTLLVNLGGAFLCAKEVLPEMIRKKWGRIINMASITGKVPLAHRTPYATSKMGMIGFTRSLAVEVGKYNITVNAICPGAVRGERNVELGKGLAEYFGKPFNPDEYAKQMDVMERQGMMAGQYLRDEGSTQALITHRDAALMALFLASEEAGSITGEDINVCAGARMG